MKRMIAAVIGIILCVNLSACQGYLSHLDKNYYSNYQAEGANNKYKISGRVRLQDKITIPSLSVLEDTSIDLDGEIKAISGDLKIVYVDENKNERIIAGNQNEKDKTIKINSKIDLKKGKGCLEFRGDPMTFRFKLFLSNIDKNKLELAQDLDGISEALAEEGNVEDVDCDNFLNTITVTYAEGDNDVAVLDTYLDEDTNVKVFVDASVLGKEDKVTFGGFHLGYKTEKGEYIPIVNYKANDTAIGGYEWQDQFEQEVKLPRGTNQLMLTQDKGSNYEITLEVQVANIEAF